jgi:hypothetical protein
MIFHIYPDMHFNCNIRIIFPLVKENSGGIFLVSARSSFAVISYEGLFAIIEIREDDNKGPTGQGKPAA